MRVRATVRLGAMAVAVATAVLTTGISAQGASGTGSGETQTVVLALTPRDRAGLAELAQDAPDLPEAVRRARLAAVVAGDDRAELVADRATALGFHVTDKTSTMVTISGPADLVATSFGSARAQNRESDTAQALPAIPPSMNGLVTVAAGGDETRPAFKPAGLRGVSAVTQPVNQAALRTLYNVPGTTGKPTANSPAIATLQFSSWSPSDLTKYAQATGVYGGDTSYDPISAGAYTGVNVDGGATTSSGAIEVSLDQSALATIAPRARQVAYFGPNSTLEQAKMLNAIAADAATRRIFAVSTSWGACEFDRYGDLRDPHNTAGANLRAGDQDAINAVLAVGVTIFAATGDSGAYDCQSPGPNAGTPSVDTPAAFTGVIGVGGTSVNTGSGSFTESAWPGSGGGIGWGFCASAAQAAILPSWAANSYCPFGKGRGVPDIGMDADPNSGLNIYLNGSQVAGPVGGTSLAAPLAAGALVQTLLSNNFLAGVGDISAIVQSGTGTSSFRDIVSSPAFAGWDTTTGSGSPDWTALGARIMGRTSTNSIYDTTVDSTTGSVRVRELSAASGYQTVIKDVQTPVVIGNRANWDFFFAPYNHDGMRDLFVILKSGTSGSNNVEIHVLSEASGYQTWILHVATPLPLVPAGEWQFNIGSFSGDGASDFYGIHYAANASNTVEVHTLSESSSYRTWIEHAASAFSASQIGSTNWTFAIGDQAGQGDLIGIFSYGTGSHRVEIHTLSRASDYRSFTLHIATPQPETNSPTFQFGATDYTGDGKPDVAFAILSATGTGKTEMHVLDGGSLYTGYALHTGTALPYLDPTYNSVSLVR